MKPMCPKCVGGALYPFARRGDFSNRDMSAVNRDNEYDKSKIIYYALYKLLLEMISPLHKFEILNSIFQLN